MPPVKSSSIKSIAWNPPDQMLIEFHSGHIHRYEGVPHSVYAALLAAPSKGQFFHKTVKGKFKSTPVAKTKGERKSD